MCTRQRSSQATPCLKRHDRAQTSQHHNYMAPTIPTMMVTLHEASFRTPGSRFSKRHPCVVPSTKAMQKTSKNSCNSRHKDVTQTSLLHAVSITPEVPKIHRKHSTAPANPVSNQQSREATTREAQTSQRPKYTYPTVCTDNVSPLRGGLQNPTFRAACSYS